jgi:GTP-binding protein
MFYDRAKILVRSGNGGDGMISFRREKHVPRGGPDGGDGGNGGNVYIITNNNLSSLVKYHRNKHFSAGNGKNGGSTKKSGGNGQDIELEVPPGTTIREEESAELLADLTQENQSVMILSGGRGGRGNTRFSSSVNRTPRMAERGEPGKELWLRFDLKLIADVGIVGVPNAGKSTLLSVVSAARPKVADYPFTTLQPNLGVVEVGSYQTMVFADIPGLIEGAASGAGLGHDFLRHIERTKVLIHLLDGAAEDPVSDWALINQELALYDARLESRPQLVVLNKMDLTDAALWEPLVEEHVESAGFRFCSISAVTRQGVQKMIYAVKDLLDATPEEPVIDEEIIVIRPAPDENAFSISRLDDGWRISGIKIERIAAMTYWEFEAPTRRFQHILEEMGISEAMVEMGVKNGDTVYIGEETLEWTE